MIHRKIIKNNNSVLKKLKILYHIQLIDSRIDEIHKFRNNVPIETDFLEKELNQFKNELKKIQEEILNLEKNFFNKNQNIKKSEKIIQQYKNKKNSLIKNSEELYSINKEIEYQKLEIQLLNKNIKELKKEINDKENILKKKKDFLSKKKKHISYKKKELKNKLLENEKEKKILYKYFLFFSKKLDDQLLKSYKRIRKKVKNGVAIAPVERGAPLGSYLSITPQKYSELIQRNELMIDEHSGRILIDSELAQEEKKKSIVYNKKSKFYKI